MSKCADWEKRSSSDSGRPPDLGKVGGSSPDSMTRTPVPGRDCVQERHRKASGSSIVDGLLFDIYDRWQRYAAADSDTFTEYSSTSDAFLGRSDSVQLDFDQTGLNRPYLDGKGVDELRQLKSDLQHRVTQYSARLIRQLKSRDRLLLRIKRHCDVITAILQASSPKRRVDSKIRFSIEPLTGDCDAFEQWRDAMRAVSKLPMGIPCEFRKKVWISLADNHISNMRIDWEKTKKFAFNERSNPDDNKLGLQIVKDLHRTGCRGFTGEDSEQDRACLKRVLLAYARWNKHVGYCQGFNIIAALILEVVDRKEEDALKVMIYLIDHMLPESYFANNLRALSVDMAVFRELLHLQLPRLSRHLDHLQVAARDHTTGANYEPPLTNVFTMQWFLTLFATCLPMSTALRVWDCVLLENSDVLLRTALAIWAKLKSRIMRVESADEFYTAMGSIAQDMLDNSIIGADELIKKMYSLTPDVFQHLAELREKYTYNITPFTAAAMATGKQPNKSAATVFSDDEDEDEMENVTCFGGIFPPQTASSHRDANRTVTGSRSDMSKVGLGAYEVTAPLAVTPEGTTSAYAERMTLDLHTLHKQYAKLRERQKQAHIILAAASAKHAASVRAGSLVVAPIDSPVVVNHLFLHRKTSTAGRNRTITGAPQIAPMYACSGVINAQLGVKTRAIARAKCLLEAQRKNIAQDGVATRKDMTTRNEAKTHKDAAIRTGGTAVTARNEVGARKDMAIRNDASTHKDVATHNDVATHSERMKRTHKRKDSTDSEVSNTSSVCGCSSVSSERSSVSSGGTVCADSESDAAQPSTSDSDIAAKTRDVTDLMWLADAVVGDTVTHDAAGNDSVNGDTKNGDAVGDDTVTDAADGDSMDDNNESHVNGRDNGCHKEVGGDTDTDSDTDNSVSGLGDRKDYCEGAETDTNVDETNDFDKSPRRSAEGEERDTRGSHLACDDAVEQTHIHSRSINNTTKPGQEGTTDSDHSPTLLQLSRGWTPPPPDVDGKENAGEQYGSRPQTGGATSPRVERVFNPFPSVHTSQRRARNGVRLGLYSTDNMPRLETGLIVGSAGVKQIGRAQINACLHHQYMAGIRQKGRNSKR